MTFDGDLAIQRLKAIKADPRLSRFQKHLQTRPIIGALRGDLDATQKQLAALSRDLGTKDRFIAVLTDMAEHWGPDPETIDPKLEKNDCSRLHRLIDAEREGRVYDSRPDQKPGIAIIAKGAQPFVVAHDWAAVIGNAAETEGDIVLPYPHCAFEFRFGGRNVIVVTLQSHSDETPEPHPAAVGFYEAANGDWCSMGGVGIDDYAAGIRCFWWRQIRAICIALDAEVASHEVKRAPHALNVKRIKAGSTPLYDFHVVDLAKRHRVAGASVGTTGHHKRLHFCRGHWRHYESHKTWIRWCLKGDPDLGFVDKEYAL